MLLNRKPSESHQLHSTRPPTCPPLHPGACLATAAAILFPAHLAGALMTLADAPIHSISDFFLRCTIAGLLFAGPAGGLMIGVWLVQPGVAAIGRRSAVPLVV